jgi:HEAT repeat protein
MLLGGLFVPAETSAQETTAEMRVRKEAIRQTIQLAYDELIPGVADRALSTERYAAHTEAVAAFGTEATDFLLPEIENPSDRFFVTLSFLGAIGDPQSIPVLRRALELEDEFGGDLGRDRKAWIGVTLARHGVEDVVDLLEDGKIPAGSTELLPGATSMDLAAMMTAPESIDRLIARFLRVTEAGPGPSEEDPSKAFLRRGLLLHAARFAASSEPHQGLLELARNRTTDPVATVRRELVGILLDHGDHDDIQRALAGLEDPAMIVRKESAKLFAEVADSNDALKLISLMKNETNIGVRATFQSAVVRLLGKAASSALMDELQDANPVIRINAVKSIEPLGSAGAPMLHKALRDPDLRVAVNAQFVLLRQRDPILLNALLPHLLDNNWSFAQSAITTVTDFAPDVAGPRVAGRLIQKELKPGSVGYAEKEHIRFLLQELVRTRFTAATDDLEKAIAKTSREDLQILSKPFLTTLRALKRYKNNPALWREQLQAEHAWTRKLARERLFELGDNEGIAAIADLFAALTLAEQEHCMTYAARFPHEAFAGRMIDTLRNPDFDGATRDEVRRQAAWAAFRLGTNEMQEALAENVRRRQGLDYLPFVYWIQMDPAAAIPWIEQTRKTRLFSIRHDRMYEQAVLDALERQWRRQIPPNGLNRPPSELRFPG